MEESHLKASKERLDLETGNQGTLTECKMTALMSSVNIGHATRLSGFGAIPFLRPFTMSLICICTVRDALASYTGLLSKR